MTRRESEAEIASFEKRFDQHVYGLWAVEVPGVASCIGFVGLDLTTFDAPFSPAQLEQLGAGVIPDGQL